jgi:bifunctional isochorismate lyase/aryl carrier protein
LLFTRLGGAFGQRGCRRARLDVRAGSTVKQSCCVISSSSLAHEETLVKPRESYLDSRSFTREVAELIAWARKAGREAFTPGGTALLVVDMQGYFLSPDSHAYLPDAEAIVPGLASLAAALWRSECPIVFTRHLNTDDNAGALGLWWNDLIRVEDPLSEISPALDTSLGTVLEKSQYDAFHETGLEELLRDRGVTRVVVTGVATHLCCETTARSAFVRGFEVTFPVDGTATYDEEHHLATLLNLTHGFATPVRVAELADISRRVRGER